MDIARPKSRAAKVWAVIASPCMILTVALMILIIGSCVATGDHARIVADRHATYAVWTKLHPETPLSYEDWEVAYRAGLLTPRR